MESIFQILGMFAIGWAAGRKGFFTEAENTKWSKFITDWLLPCLIFSSITKNFEAHRILELWTLPFIGFGIMFVSFLLGFILKKRLKTKDDDIIRTFHHCCVVNNFTFLPIIIIQNVFGESALSRLFFFNLGSHIGLWTIGVSILAKRNVKSTFSGILSPAIITILFSLFISVTGLKAFIPDTLIKISAYAGSAAVPLILLLIGATLYSVPSGINGYENVYLCLVRLLLLPCINILILKASGLPEDVFYIALVVAIMPVAVSSTPFAGRFGGSPAFAATAALFTTVCSMFTVPLWLWVVG